MNAIRTLLLSTLIALPASALALQDLPPAPPLPAAVPAPATVVSPVAPLPPLPPQAVMTHAKHAPLPPLPPLAALRAPTPPAPPAAPVLPEAAHQACAGKKTGTPMTYSADGWHIVGTCSGGRLTARSTSKITVQ